MKGMDLYADADTDADADADDACVHVGAIQERDELQQKQISELLQQKAWLQRQMGLPEIVA